MTASQFAEPRFSANVLPRVPARRWGLPEDFAGIAVYLMSDASAYMTGEALVLDGGYTLF
jgi:NAD(P)-dependent dehydrogenase (short-subunit alcohol dehydrogenase family)